MLLIIAQLSSNVNSFDDKNANYAFCNHFEAFRDIMYRFVAKTGDKDVITENIKGLSKNANDSSFQESSRQKSKNAIFSDDVLFVNNLIVSPETVSAFQLFYKLPCPAQSLPESCRGF